MSEDACSYADGGSLQEILNGVAPIQTSGDGERSHLINPLEKEQL